MKKNLLLMMLCCPMVLAAQNGDGVAVSGLAVDAGTVTFNVSWNRDAMPVALWSDTVWVFVDYNNNGTMERLPVTSATASAGTVTKIPNNDKGVWVEGNARTNGNFSAKVELFTEIKDVAGACAYASNYPPVGKYLSASEVSFTGTPEYKVVLERSNKSTYTVTVGKGESLPIPNGEAALSFTDKTGAPGLIGIHQPQGSCTYTAPAVVGTFAAFPNNYDGGTYVSLVDERDNKIYPVLKMGGRWMMARNLNYQKGLYHNTASNQANGVSFTSVTNGVPAIGSYWCPGSGETSTKEACEVYGALYTWETAMMLDGTGTWTEDGVKYTSLASAGTYNHGRTAHSGSDAGGRGICPPNWHVPTDAEWGVFLDAVEGDGTAHQDVSGRAWAGVNAGKYSKSACTGTPTESDPLWVEHVNSGSDSYGFRVLPTGFRYNSGYAFVSLGLYTFLASSSASDDLSTPMHRFSASATAVEHPIFERRLGVSVRCIRD